MINGAVNHDNACGRYRDVLKFHSASQLYSGFSLKLMHSLIYFGIVLALEKQGDLY